MRYFIFHCNIPSKSTASTSNIESNIFLSTNTGVYLIPKIYASALDGAVYDDVTSCAKKEKKMYCIPVMSPPMARFPSIKKMRL